MKHLCLNWILCLIIGGLFFSMFPASIRAQNKNATSGTIAGTVVDEKGEPVAGVIAVVLGLPSIGTATDGDGKYVLSGIPEKTVAVQFSLLSYETLLVENVKVVAGTTVTLHAVLKEATTQLAEVTITANISQSSTAGMLMRQKTAVSMTDGISAEQIQRTGDNNVAQALKRVAGVIVNNGKFVTVRGMSERYNNVLINGAEPPSTEPNRRDFAFDVIPTTLIDNVIVNKTFTPDLPGEFAGGLVQVRTLSIPTERFFKFAAGGGGNSESTGKEFKSNRRFDADYAFGEKDARTWYAGRNTEDIPLSNRNAAMMNHFGFDKYRAIPMQNYSVTCGLPFRLTPGQSIGLVAAATYRHEETIETIKEVNLRGRDYLMYDVAPGKNYKFVTATGAIANIGWKAPNHDITWKNLFNNRFTHTNQERMMRESYGGAPQIELLSSPQIASFTQSQIDGEHRLFNKNVILSWTANYNTSARITPDDRFACGDLVDVSKSGGLPQLYDGKYMADWGVISPSYFQLGDQHLMYSKLNENKKNAGANLEYLFKLFSRQQKLKAGYLFNARNADFQQEYLHAGFVNPTSSEEHKLHGLPLQEFYNPEHFTNNLLYYFPSGLEGRAVDYYEGSQTLEAAYLMAEFSPVKQLQFVGGLRVENSITEVQTVYVGIDPATNRLVIKNDAPFRRTARDFLPSLTAIYIITSSLNFRASGGKTLARPDFRELSYVRYYNINDRVDVVNRGQLEQTSTENYDLRLEWYPQDGEIVSLSTFYKEFTKPVEKIARVKADQQNYDLFTENLDRATVKGVELNFRKSFGFVAPALSDLWLTGNLTALEGNVAYSLINDKERNRPLQGLAPYVINGSALYESVRWGAAVNYTRMGRILVMSGEYAKHDEYENPRNVLDLQFYVRFFSQQLEVKLNLSDLLNEDMIVYRNRGYETAAADDPGPGNNRMALGMDYNDGDYVMSRISRGVNLSLSVSYKL